MDKMKLKENGRDPNYAAYCDHTVLRAYTTREKIAEFCEEAVKYRVASVCVNPVHVVFVRGLLEDTQVRTSTVIGFPLGANKTCVKVMETVEAVKDGAQEVDMVINVGAVRDGDYDYVQAEIREVVEAARGKALVKVIIETCYLTKSQINRVCILAAEEGADFIKTSTGMGSGGARTEDVEFIRSVVKDQMKIKASGDIADRQTARKMLLAGADRLGVSRTPQIVEDSQEIISAAAANQPPIFPDD